MLSTDSVVSSRINNVFVFIFVLGSLVIISCTCGNLVLYKSFR